MEKEINTQNGKTNYDFSDRVVDHWIFSTWENHWKRFSNNNHNNYKNLHVVLNWRHLYNRISCFSFFVNVSCRGNECCMMWKQMKTMLYIFKIKCEQLVERNEMNQWEMRERIDLFISFYEHFSTNGSSFVERERCERIKTRFFNRYHSHTILTIKIWSTCLIPTRGVNSSATVVIRT